MLPEREQKSVPVLTETQQRVRSTLVSSLQDAKEQTCIVLEGISGTGKDTVVNSMADIATRHNGTIIDGDKLGYIEHDYDISTLGHIITTKEPDISFTYRNRIEELQRKLPGITTVSCILPAMSPEEMKSYIHGVLNISQSPLSLDQITRYSLGVPLLARQLVRSNKIAEHEAIEIAGGYLARSARQAVRKESEEYRNKYFQSPIPSEVIVAARKSLEVWGSQKIYSHLYGVMDRQLELHKRGIQEEEPFFTAPESESIYDHMLQSTGFSSIDIFVPNLSVEDLERIQKSCGYDPDKYGISTYDERNDPSRPEMFDASFRKTSFWHRDNDGQEMHEANEFARTQKYAHNYEQAYQEGLFGIVPVPNERQGKFLIHSHEHFGLTAHTAIIGWMMESLLQQRGISYFVNNDTFGASYYFDAEQNCINILENRVKINWY